MEIEQSKVDILYNGILLQKIRYDHFKSVAPTTQPISIWNRSNDEKKMLDILIEKYKSYYINKAEELKVKLAEIRDYNTSSYMTYNKSYYLTEYTTRFDEVNRYIEHIRAKTIIEILNDKLGIVSEHIESMFPRYMANPTLIGEEL